VGAEFQVSTNADYSWQVSDVAMDSHGNAIIAWRNNESDGWGYGVYAQRYDRKGNPVGAEFQVNTYYRRDQHLAKVAMDARGNAIITWASNLQDGDGYGIYAQRYDSKGNPVGTEFQVNTYTTSFQDYPAVAMDAHGNAIITWASAGQDGDWWGVYAQSYYWKHDKE
jgi:hypothetical protein